MNTRTTGKLTTAGKVLAAATAYAKAKKRYYASSTDSDRLWTLMNNARERLLEVAQRLAP